MMFLLLAIAVACLLVPSRAVGQQAKGGVCKGDYSGNLQGMSNSRTDHLLFYVFADWGIGGYDGNQTSSGNRRALGDTEEEDAEEKEEVEDTRELGGGGGGNNQKKNKYKKYYQHYVAAAMDSVAQSDGSPDAFLSLGDNFYKNGVSSPNDSMFSTHYQKVYRQYNSLKNVPIYTIPGNHDYGVGRDTMNQAQGPQRRAYDDLWCTPAANYSLTYDIPGGGVASFVMTDTTTLSPQTTKWTSSEGGISADEQQALIVDQSLHLWKHYCTALEAGSNWIVTMGHYPIASYGDHGDNTYLEQNLLKFIQYFGSQSYVSGHDHILMHMQGKGLANPHQYNDTTEYFIVGAGSMNDQVKQTSEQSDLIWAGQSYSGFMTLKVYKTKMVYSMYDTSAQVVYAYTQTNAFESPTARPTSERTLQYSTRMPSQQLRREPTLMSTSEPTPSPTVVAVAVKVSIFNKPVVVMGAAAFGLVSLLAIGFLAMRKKTKDISNPASSSSSSSSFSTSSLFSSLCATRSLSRSRSPNLEAGGGEPFQIEKIRSRLRNPSISALLGTYSPRSRAETVSSVEESVSRHPSPIGSPIKALGNTGLIGGSHSSYKASQLQRSLEVLHQNPPNLHRKSKTMPI